MGESGFYDIVIISLFYQKMIGMSYTSALPRKFYKVISLHLSDQFFVR